MKALTPRYLIAVGIVASLCFIGPKANATTYRIHVGGMCSTQFLGGKGGGTLGNWSGSTSINAAVDQRNSMSTATTQLAGILNQYCTGSNWCYLYTYSNGGAVISRTLSLYSTNWNIGYVLNSASNEGGSEIGGTGWVGEIFGGCTLAGHIGTSDHRSGWNHDDTNGETIYGTGGYDGWWYSSGFLPGEDDGAVAYHSAGALNDTYNVDWLCYQSQYHYSNHYTAWTCEGYDLDHYGMKMKGICMTGGC